MQPWSFNQPVLLNKSRHNRSVLVWTIVGATTFAGAWAFLAPLPETVALQGKLQPARPVQDIEAAVDGLVAAVPVKEGDSVAVISDAGLPGISDPGEELAAAARMAGHEVICIPGPCAATTALVSSGLPSGRFCFEGFLPVKGRERRDRLQQIAVEQRTTVLYEAPHRLLALLVELQEHCGAERPLQVARELTKRHEQQVGPTIAAALEHFNATRPQGEFTLVLGGSPLKAAIEPDDQELLQRLEQHMAEGASASEAARQVAQDTGIGKRRIYALLHQGTAN